MKHLRRLLPALCLLLISAMCAGTSTYAWFSLNNKVDATGIKVKAKATGTLVIDTSSLNSNSNGTTVDLSSGTDAIELKPAVYSGTTPLLKTLSASYAECIDSSTGIFYSTPKKSGDPTGTPTDSHYTESGVEECFVKYDVWVGYQGETAITSAAFTITASVASGNVENVQRALSVLYSVDGGTTWYNECVGSGQAVTLDSFAPAAASAGGTHVIVKVYFDGSMNDPDAPGCLIVRTGYMSLKDVTLKMEFTSAS